MTGYPATDPKYYVNLDPRIISVCSTAEAAAVGSWGVGGPAVFTACTRAALAAKVGWFITTYGPKAIELAKNDMILAALATPISFAEEHLQIR
jgi:hypothetical protein